MLTTEVKPVKIPRRHPRASMFQWPEGPGLLPAFKMLKIEPRIPSKWLIVVETENCWRLFNMFKSDVKSGQKWQRTGAANIRGGSGWQPQGRLHRRYESAHWSGENFQFLCCGKDNLSNLNPSYIRSTYYIDYVHKSLRSRLFHQAQQKKYRNDDVAHR